MLFRWASISLVLISALAFGACGSASAGLLTSSVPLSNARPYKVLRQAKTTVSWFEPNFILFNWPGKVPLDEARRRLLQPQAVKAADGKQTTPAPAGDALINVRYWTDQFYLPGFYWHRLHMKGDVIKFR